jgi:sugar/nucleoside kinase (ribokinase family)
MFIKNEPLTPSPKVHFGKNEPLTPSPKVQKYDVICIGMTVVDSIIKGFDPTPVSASGYKASSGAIFAGGEAVNEAIAAAKLGLKTGIFCCLGKDAAGDMIVAELERYGVSTDLILRHDDRQTPVTTLLVNEDGTRKSITNDAHRYNFRPDLHHELFTSARAVILGSLFRAPFDDPDIIFSVINAAKEAGQIVIADTKLPNFRVLGLADLKAALPLIDYITPNEDEAKYFTGKEDPEEMADVFLNYGVKNVLIKLGAKGCFFKNAAEKIALPAFNIRAIDSTGAGDNMIAGLASEILKKAPHVEALKFANGCGAICTTEIGAGTALKSRKQVLEFLKMNP